MNDVSGHPNTFPPTHKWFVHFVSPSDGRYADLDWPDYMPPDGLDGPYGYSFNVLEATVRLRAILPGLPDGLVAKGAAPSMAVFQRLDTVDFQKRWDSDLTGCGVALLHDHLVSRGATGEVILGREDLVFDNLLAWKANLKLYEYTALYWDKYGIRHEAYSLPLFGPVKVVFFVDYDFEASLLQELLTIQWMACAFDRLEADRWSGALIVWPVDNPGAFANSVGLSGFEEIPARLVTPELTELFTSVCDAFLNVEHIIESQPIGQTFHYNYLVRNRENPMVRFLSDIQLAYRTKDPDRYRLRRPFDWGAEIYVVHPDRAYAVRDAFEAALGLEVVFEIVPQGQLDPRPKPPRPDNQLFF